MTDSPPPLIDSPRHRPISINTATNADREAIYRARHEVFARELGQHLVNPQGRLTDNLDTFNDYLVARHRGCLAGFVSITPPGHGAYAIDKYLDRGELPFACDDALYEVRLLTVLPAHRHRPIAGLLMYAALRWIESRGGTRILAIGRHEVLGLYRKVGLHLLGREVAAGAVRFELMTGIVRELGERLAGNARYMRIVGRWLDRAVPSVGP